MVRECPRPANFGELGDSGVVLLVGEGRMGDGPGDRVVLLARGDQQGAPVWIAGVDLGLGPRVEVGGAGLEDRRARSRDCECLVEVLGFFLSDRVGEGVTELVVGERHRAVVISRVAEYRRGRPERGDRQRQYASERRRVYSD